MARDPVGKGAADEKGWIRSHKWLVMRRISQLSIIALFLIGSVTTLDALDEWGEPVRIIKGNLVSSLVLDTVPLTDPFVYLQTLQENSSKR